MDGNSEAAAPVDDGSEDDTRLAKALAIAMDMFKVDGMAMFEAGDGDLKEQIAASFAELKQEAKTSDGAKINEVSDEDGSKLFNDVTNSECDDRDEFSPWEELQAGIKKRLITPSPHGAADFRFGSLAFVHFQSTIVEPGGAETPLDDTNFLGGGPLEYLVLTNQVFPTMMFLLQSMRVQEMATFIIEEDHVEGYSEIMSWWRRKCQQRRMPGVTEDSSSRKYPVPDDVIKDGSCGFADLDELERNPRSLRLQLELCILDEPNKVDREMLCADTIEEKVAIVPRLRERGVSLYKAGMREVAYDRFRTALQFCGEALVIETPQGKRFEEYRQLYLPILLNCTQCALNRGEFEQADTWCSIALDIDPSSTKALVRRGRARVGDWQPALARQDFLLAASVDKSLQPLVDRELEALQAQEEEAAVKLTELLASYSQSKTLPGMSDDVQAMIERQLSEQTQRQLETTGRHIEAGEEELEVLSFHGTGPANGVLRGACDALTTNGGVCDDNTVEDGQFDDAEP